MENAKKWMNDNEKNIKVEIIEAYGKELIFIKEGNKTLAFVPPKELESERKEEEPKEEGVEVKVGLTEEVEQQLAEMKQAIAELKEGRVLSGKNLKLVKDCREQIGKTGELLDKLIVASEPPKEENILSLIEESKSKDNGNDINGLTKNDIPILVEEVLKGIKEGMAGQRKEIQEVFDNKLGKV